MIRELKIANLAIIEELHLTFNGGLTVLTGETGAGKSIILQAINLLTGGKASSSAVRNDEEAATVEALFEIPPQKKGILREIRDNGFGAEDSLVIKRILTNQGRSRYYINGSLATVRQVTGLAPNLLTIAGQRDHQRLLDPALHLDVIDSIGNLWDERRQFADLFGRWNELQNRLKKLQKQENEKEQRRDLLLFQCNEIRKAEIQPGEDTELTIEKNRLKSIDTLVRLGGEGLDMLDETIIDTLARVRKNLEQMATLDEGIADLAHDVADSFYQLEDQTKRLHDYHESVADDPERLDFIDSRLDMLQRLKKKYAGPEGTLAEVLAHADQAEDDLNQLDSLEEQLQGLSLEITHVEQTLLTQAAHLTERRRSEAEKLALLMRKELLSLRFGQVEFEVFFKPMANDLRELDETGWDRPEFLFSANPGVPVKPLVNIISGGELSRVMLAFKCLLAKKDMVETVLFDEVDAGIGGQAAEAVARKIKELAGHHQVLCITHLPQIATYADAHYLVTKSVKDGKTRLSIGLLPKEHRARELARMLAGDAVTEKTLRYAEELAGNN
jgi:DNA repair protein RecN (Recombination protein N)